MNEQLKLELQPSKVVERKVSYMPYCLQLLQVYDELNFTPRNRQDRKELQIEFADGLPNVPEYVRAKLVDLVSPNTKLGKVYKLLKANKDTSLEEIKAKTNLATIESIRNYVRFTQDFIEAEKLIQKDRKPEREDAATNFFALVAEVKMMQSDIANLSTRAARMISILSDIENY